jgi:oligoendopeptidase F
LEEFHRYDLYAPISSSDQKTSYSDAVDIVQEAFYAFDPRFADLAMRIIREDHMDSEIRHGKRSGAFCLTAGPQLTPWFCKISRENPQIYPQWLKGTWSCSSFFERK